MSVIVLGRQLKGVLIYNVRSYVTKQPVDFFLSVIRTFSMLVLLAIFAGPELLPQVLMGLVMAFTFGMGLSQLSVDYLAMKRSQLKDMYVSSPLNQFIFMIGTAAGASIPSLIQILVVFIMIAWFYSLSIIQLMGVLFLLVVLWTSSISLGFLISLRIQTPHTLFNVTDGLYSILVYIAPVYYPIELLPEFIRPIALLSPVAAAALLIREVANLSHYSSALLLQAVTVFAAFTIVMLFLVLVKIKWRDN